MGKGFWILVWDDWGSGLNMINPRLYTRGDRNWWPYQIEAERDSLIQEFGIEAEYGDFYRIID